MQAELGPRRGERGEDLGAGEHVAAVGQRHRVGVAAEQHQVVPGLADAEGEQLAGGGAGLHEREVVESAIPHDLRDPGPHQVHVHRQRGGGSRGGEPLLQHGGLGESETGAAPVGGHEDRQVPGGAQLVDVLLREPVVAVVAGGTVVDAR